MRASKYQNWLRLGLLLCLAFVSLVPALQAQSQRSAADIIRQGQERQQAIEKAGEDLRRSAQEIFDREQRRRDEEREQQARDREQEAQERREREAERQRRSQEEQLENFRRSMERQAESQRQLQQNIDRTLQQGYVRQAVTSGSSTGGDNNHTINPEIVPAGGSATATKPLRLTANALPGNPNDAASARKDWGPWEHVSGNIWVSYCKVSNKFDKGHPLWTWALKNWNDRVVKTVWFEYSEDGQWRKDLTPYSLKPSEGHGGWGSFTAVGDTPPSIRIQKVEFK